MQECTVTANVTVVNPHGMHLRPADMFARTAAKFTAEVSVLYNGQRVDGKSIVDLLMMAARQGTQLTLRASGADAEQALAALVELVQQGFGEMAEEPASEAAASPSNPSPQS